MTVFEAAKQISCNDAAERLGLRGKRTSQNKGMWCCPFHDDHTPSMACFDRDNRFYCFTCHASGDAANLYQKVLGLSAKPAAEAALRAAGMAIPGGCDRPREAETYVRQQVVNRAAWGVRRAYQYGVTALLQAQVDAMVAVMEKYHDPEGWMWNHALQRACRLQEEVKRWQDISDEDLVADMAESLAEGRVPSWGEELPTPGKALFLGISDELTRTQDTFPKLTRKEEAVLLETLSNPVMAN